MTNMAARNDTMELEDALTPARTNREPRGHRRLAYNDRQPLPGNEQVSVSDTREGALTPARTTGEPRGHKRLTYNDRQPLRGEEQASITAPAYSANFQPLLQRASLFTVGPVNQVVERAMASPFCLPSMHMGPAQPVLPQGTLFPITMVGTQPLQITESPCVGSLLPAANQNTGTSLSSQMDEERTTTATSQPPATTSFVIMLEVDTQGQKRYPDLVFVKKERKDGIILEVTQKSMKNVPEAGYISVARIIFDALSSTDLSYDVQILFTSVQKGTVVEIDEALKVCHVISSQGDYKFCPGLHEREYYDNYYTVIRYHLKSVRLWEKPFKRIDSQNCVLWHQLKKNASKQEKCCQEVMCRPCKRLHSDLDHQRRRSDVSPSKRLKRQQPSSSFKLKYLSPASTTKRRTATQKERSLDKAKASRLSEFDITLEDDQSDEVCEIVSTIKEKCSEELETILNEADAHSENTGSSIRSSWERDMAASKASCKTQFYSDQLRNGTGNKGNRWSLITIRIALAVYVRSPAAYEALKSFKILQLPSKSTLQSYTGAFLHEAGACAESIIRQVAQYKTFQQSFQDQSGAVPLSDGTIIFDEVKVISSLIWNSRSHHLVGLAMSSQEQANLQDIFAIFDPTSRIKQTNYILQFLWRDLTSNFDIVGPYFTSENPMTAKYVMACVLETVKLFQIYGLKTSLLVCDGGAPNLAALKSTHGCFGAYGSETDGSQHSVKPWFINPFNPPNHIFWLICPTHQLKNMINALFASKAGGTRRFQNGAGTLFGWQAIVDMYQRECERRDTGSARMIPRLREIHIIRDSWTKLNVTPAKIMQQELVLAELYRYINSDPTPSDAASVRCTLEYLEACNQLFEKGFLSHSKICDGQGSVLTSIQKGYAYFVKWYNDLYGDGSTTDAKFLSWQTWDLLRVCVYGMTGFAEWFLHEYPSHFISPIRLSGSAVETLFSQFKHCSGGKLSSSNYAVARASHLIKHTVSSHHSSKGYRDVALDLPQCALQKKTYGK